MHVIALIDLAVVAAFGVTGAVLAVTAQDRNQVQLIPVRVKRRQR